MPKKFNMNYNTSAVKTTKIRFKVYKKKIKKGIKSLKPDDDSAKFIHGLTGLEGRPEQLLASDLPGRDQAITILTEELQSKWVINPALKFFMVTLIDAEGNTSDRAPDIKFEKLISKAGTLIRSWKVDGLVIGELQAFTNHPGKGQGRTLCAQPNALIWTEDAFAHKAIEKVANASRAWKDVMGAKGVDIRPIPTANDLTRVVHYLLKPPHSGKNVMPHKKKPGKILLMDTVEGYRPDLALRVCEGLSQIDFLSLFLGVNGGTTVRQRVRKRLLDWHKKRSAPIVVPQQSDVWHFWAMLRREKGSQKYLPFRFDGCVAGVLSPKPASTPRNSLNRRGPRRPPGRKNGPMAKPFRPLGGMKRIMNNRKPKLD